MLILRLEFKGKNIFRPALIHSVCSVLLYSPPAVPLLSNNIKMVFLRRCNQANHKGTPCEFYCTSTRGIFTKENTSNYKEVHFNRFVYNDGLLMANFHFCKEQAWKYFEAMWSALWSCRECAMDTFPSTITHPQLWPKVFKHKLPTWAFCLF